MYHFLFYVCIVVITQQYKHKFIRKRITRYSTYTHRLNIRMFYYIRLHGIDS